MQYGQKCNICSNVKENSIYKNCNSCWLELVNKWSIKSWNNLGNGDLDND